MIIKKLWIHWTIFVGIALAFKLACPAREILNNPWWMPSVIFLGGTMVGYRASKW